MITARQIHAARALLRASQADIAKHTNISTVAYSNLERGKSLARPETLDEIRYYFESRGIEFTEGEGVRLSDEVYNLYTFDGPDGPLLFLKDIIRSLRRQTPSKRQVCWFGSNNTPYFRRNKGLYLYYQNLTRLNAHERIVTYPGFTEFYGPPSISTYGGFGNPEIFKYKLVMIYAGVKYAMITPKKILVIEHKAFYAPLAAEFDHTWNNSQPITIPPNALPQFHLDDQKWGSPTAKIT